jgi:hypothetical protein
VDYSFTPNNFTGVTPGTSVTFNLTLTGSHLSNDYAQFFIPGFGSVSITEIGMCVSVNELKYENDVVVSKR